MLDNLERVLPARRQKDDFKRLLASVFRYIFHLAQYLRETGEDQTIGDGQILEEAIARIWHDYQFRDDGTPRADLACFPQGFAARVAREHATIIDELVSYGFAPFGLGQNAVQQLKEIAVFAVVKDLFLEDVTGLVFAGFGTDDRYPVCRDLSALGHRRRHRQARPRRRSTSSTPKSAPRSACSPTAK